MSEFPILPKDVYSQLAARAKQDPDLERFGDISRGMAAGPALAGIMEAAKIRGGAGLNVNPLLAWASGLPGAPKNLGAIAKASPYVSPTDTIAKLMAMGEGAGAAQQQYLKERDKFFATQMGRPVGAAGIAGKQALERTKGEIRQGIKDDEQEFEERMLEKKLAAAKSEEEAERIRKERDRLRQERKEAEEADAKADKEAKNQIDRLAKGHGTIINAYEALRSIEEILAKYEGTGNYPGIGVGGSDIATTAQKLFKNPADAIQYLKDSQTVQAKYKELIALRNRTLSGLQSTDREFKRAIQQLGDAPWQAEDIGVKGLRDLARAMGKGLDVDFKSLNKRAQQKYLDAGYYTAKDFYDFNLGGTKVGAPTRRKSSRGGKKEVKRQYSPSRNKTKITYDDGSSEIVDGRQTK